MNDKLPTIYLARHGETEWSRTGQYTGRTDLPLTELGEKTAWQLGARLRGMTFAKVFTSPLRRAARTCELAGFGDVAQVDADLVEWDYGKYNSLTLTQILRDNPGWQLFRDGCPGGETTEQICARAERVVQRLRVVSGDVLLFSSGHFMRVLATRWLGVGLDWVNSRFLLNTASLSALSYEHNLSNPVIRLWNDDRHVTE